ncbi:translesion DNA synthesis-associated protein ImuA [Xanthomonas campestris pv. cannae]|nr:translesion DNA synthesis-associated protein ImuA [Xanthomonas campestris pv. cannae]
MSHRITSPRAFDSTVLPPHVAEAVWLGADVGQPLGRTVPSGFDALDAQLPGGGWPTHTLTELLMPQPALCEWRLLGPAVPAMLASDGCIYLVAPPKQPHTVGLAQLGLPPDRVVWIHASAPADRLWVTEQLLKSNPAGAVLSWLPQARPEQIRRLQVHAQSCDAAVFLLRPTAALSGASPAPLRVAAALGGGWQLEVRIPKRRGAPLDNVLHLEAIPASLAPMLPPRLRTTPAPSPQPRRKEPADVPALGRAASPSALGLPASH